jgi:hypothetical protein
MAGRCSIGCACDDHSASLAGWIEPGLIFSGVAGLAALVVQKKHLAIVVDQAHNDFFRCEP